MATTTTDIKSEKLALIHDILAVEDERLLALVRKLLESALSTQHPHSTGDFWEELPSQLREEILESIRQIDDGEGIPNASVMSEVKRRFAA